MNTSDDGREEAWDFKVNPWPTVRQLKKPFFVYIIIMF